MLVTSSLALAAAALPLVAASPIKRDNNYKNVVYWGANDSEQDLSHYCQSGSGIDIIVLSFLSNFGDGTYPNGYIGNCQINSDQSYSGCDGVASAIDTCQSNGIKVFLSVGGGGANWGLSGNNDASGVAYSLWNSYANPNAVASGSSRPFGNSFVNGWDFDLESQQGNSYEYVGDMINSLRNYFGDDSSNSYYISGAPQCVIPDANMGDAISQAQFDYLFIQFYNNECAAEDLFADSNNNPDGSGGSYNLASWPSYVSGGASANAQLLVGLPGAPDAASNWDYVQPSNLGQLISDSQSVQNFGGIMIFDAGASDESVNTSNGQTYAQAVKSALKNA